MPNATPNDREPTIRVLIRPGCIVCHLCAGLCPEVFEITDAGCVVRGVARADGVTSHNRVERSPLVPFVRNSAGGFIEEAVEACPVGVIVFERPSTSGRGDRGR